MNILLNNILYIMAVFCILFYLFGRYKTTFSKKYFKVYVAFIFVYFIGISIAYFRGLSLGHDITLINSDLSRSLVFPLTMTLIGLISRMNGAKYLERFTIAFVLIFICAMLLNKFWGFEALGDLIKITTRQLFNASIFGFFGLYLLTTDKHKNVGRLILLAAWIIIVFSVAKWNFFAILILPVMWIVIETIKISFTKRMVFCVVTLSIISAIVFNFRDNIASFATGYADWRTFWYKRVLTTDLANGGQVRDGNRLLIWEDLLNQFSKAPFLGVGLGARTAFGPKVEDHNMFIFFLIRFGAPLFVMESILALILIALICRNKEISGIRRLILFLLFIYYFQNAAIDTVPFGEIINGVVVATVVGLILNQRNNRCQSKDTYVLDVKNQQSAKMLLFE